MAAVETLRRSLVRANMPELLSLVGAAYATDPFFALSLCREEPSPDVVETCVTPALNAMVAWNPIATDLLVLRDEETEIRAFAFCVRHQSAIPLPCFSALGLARREGLRKMGKLLMDVGLGAIRRFSLASGVAEAAYVRDTRTLPNAPSVRRLEWLTVDPTVQGTGLGTALVTEFTRASDRERLPSWLSCHSDRLECFYKRFGFERASAAPAWTGDADAPTIISMVRHVQR